MDVKIQPLKNPGQTCREIYESAEYTEDIESESVHDLQTFFNFVRDIPFLEDPPGREIVSRPKYLLDENLFPGLDCKKKAVLMGAYFNANKLPWRLVISSDQPNKKIHHVFPQVRLNRRWNNADATYPDNILFAGKPEITLAKEIKR